MMRTTLRLLGVASLGLVGCASVSKALPYASYRSGCDAENIHVVEEGGSDAVLDVCGQRERWSWNGFDGWTYQGPATPRATTH